MISTFTLAAKVLRFPCIELWVSATYDSEKYTCTYVYADSKIIEDYPDLIVGHNPDQKGEHEVSPSLCALAKMAPSKFHWKVNKTVAKPTRGKFSVKTELAYWIQGDTGSVCYFIVALSPSERKFKESKIKYLCGIGYCLYVSAFVCSEDEDEEDDDDSKTSTLPSTFPEISQFKILGSSGNLNTTAELDQKTPSIHSVPTSSLSQLSRRSLSSVINLIAKTKDSVSRTSGGSHCSKTTFGSSPITQDVIDTVMANRTNSNRSLLSFKESSASLSNKNLSEIQPEMKEIEPGAIANIEGPGSFRSELTNSDNASENNTQYSDNRSESIQSSFFGTKLSGIDSEFSEITRGGAPTWEPCQPFNFPMSQIPCQYNLLHDLTLNIFTDVSYVADGSNSNIYLARFDDQQVIVKMIKQSVQSDPISCHEFDVEHGMLSRTNHPGIIKLLGAGNTPRRFIVLEYLAGGTLSEVLNKYHTKTHFTQRLFRQPTFTYAVMLEKAKEIALAMQYLHAEFHSGATIVHRDLKPDNLGFAFDGKLKLFDLGLATCVKSRASMDDTYAMTGQTGSLRYMAPEVALNQPYTEKVDVYSFGILLWQIARDKVPFQGFDKYSFYRDVVSEGERPKLSRSWPERFNVLIRSTWDADPAMRPSFAKIIEELDALMVEEQKSSGNTVYAVPVPWKKKPSSHDAKGDDLSHQRPYTYGHSPTPPQPQYQH